MVLRKTGHSHVESKFVTLPHTIYPNYLNGSCIWSYKTLTREHGVNLYDLVLGNCSLHMTPKTSNKEKVNWSWCKLKLMCFKGHHQETEKIAWIFANHISENGLVSRMYEEFIWLNKKVTHFLNMQKIWIGIRLHIIISTFIYDMSQNFIPF